MTRVFRLLLGLGGERNARVVQLVWLLVGPSLAIIFALLLEGVGLMSWLLLGLLAAGFFWDGLQGWGWARRRLWILGGYYLAALAMFLADSWGYSLDSLLLQYAVLPILWPISLLGLLNGDLASGALAVLGAWLALFLAYQAGASKRGRGEAAPEGRSGEEVSAPGGKNAIAESGENRYNSSDN